MTEADKTNTGRLEMSDIFQQINHEITRGKTSMSKQDLIVII